MPGVKHLALAAAALWLAASCSTHRAPQPMPSAPTPLAPLTRVKQKFAPDSHVAIFTVEARLEDGQYILTGDVDNPDAKREAAAAVAELGHPVADHIRVLPSPDLGAKTWGIASLSVLNVREKPGNFAEMGTQILMGNAFKIWKKETNWWLVQSQDHYLGWVENGFTASTAQDVKNWNDAALLIVTALDGQILAQPKADAAPMSDVVLCDLVKRLEEQGDWLRVGLPDGRSGWLPKTACADFAAWQKERRPTAENIERAARSFMGRPYFWGCNSPRGMDCSGFTKLVFYLNGIALDRNASQQARQGTEAPLDDHFSHLKKGDLLFFGHRASEQAPELVNHVGIYLGDKLFIHASGMIHISSLDENSPLLDARRRRGLLHARRFLEP
ncbi:MAG TPA: SH3 domain-containing C40 family peptidase [Verrucomicrobiae bacterium]|jgi:cell wall-associated NlpC family hydrolase|nr:SH3 domain-containing C40 family peptidase [Verrucomicrobiae bacterium]